MPPKKKLDVFLSSDIKEFQRLRRNLSRKINEMPFLESTPLEDRGADTSNVTEASLQGVREADFYVGIFGKEYSETTIKEYQEAKRNYIPILTYVKHLTRRDGRRDSRVATFIKEDLEPNFKYDKFSSNRELVKQVKRDINSHLFDILVKGLASIQQSKKNALNFEMKASRVQIGAPSQPRYISLMTQGSLALAKGEFLQAVILSSMALELTLRELVKMDPENEKISEIPYASLLRLLEARKTISSDEFSILREIVHLRNAILHEGEIPSRELAEWVLHMAGQHVDLLEASRRVGVQRRDGVTAYVWPTPHNGFYNLQEVNDAAPATILTGSQVDLTFVVKNDESSFRTKSRMMDAIAIYIPPEFGLTDQDGSVIATDYSRIQLSSASPRDRYGPGWCVVYPSAGGSASYSDLQCFRLNSVSAPSIAGKYFFKIALVSHRTSDGVHEGTTASIALDQQSLHFIPFENWPVVLAKGEIDSATLTGTIRHGDSSRLLQDQPMSEAGKVWLHMTSKLDSSTGNELTGYPLVDAVGYFNARAKGHYEVEGVAAGVYDVYASAGGYPNQLIATGMRVLKGQSLLLNGYLNPGVVINGKVFTKHGLGKEPWPSSDYIKIEIYANPTVGNKVARSAGSPISWSPLPCISAGPKAIYMSESDYVRRNKAYDPMVDATYCAYRRDHSGNPLFDSPVGFPWPEYRKFHPTISTDRVSPDEAIVDEQGVGPPQGWIVSGGTTTPFQFQFGEIGKYGAPCVLDGHIPQIKATWVDGLAAGRYYVRAWTAHYIQSETDRATFHEVYFDIGTEKSAADIAVSIDLQLTSVVNMTVHFHDTPGSLKTSPIRTGTAYLTGGLYDVNGIMWAWNQTKLDSTAVARGIAMISFYGFRYRLDGRDYGIPAGQFTPKVYARGYAQETFQQGGVGLEESQMVSAHLWPARRRSL